MYCNSCGMNSLDAEVCEWCKNPIGAKKAPAGKTAPAPLAQPLAPQPIAAQPLAAQPLAAQPLAAQPLAAQPLAAQSAVPASLAPLDLTQPIPPGLEVTQAVSHGGNVRM